MTFQLNLEQLRRVYTEDPAKVGAVSTATNLLYFD